MNGSLRMHGREGAGRLPPRYPAPLREGGPLIKWWCVREQHRAAGRSDAPQITVHEGRWAYCPATFTRSRRQWRETAELTAGECQDLGFSG